MKTVLITGGTGFLGSHLSKKLMGKGCKVICIDNNYAGSMDNIKELHSNSDFKFIEHDIIHPIQINENIDEIYNLATPASP